LHTPIHAQPAPTLATCPRLTPQTLTLATLWYRPRGLLVRLKPLGPSRSTPALPSRRAAGSRASLPKMASGTPSKPAEKSILSSAVDSINPWATSRTATPVADKAKDADNDPKAGANASDDHSVAPLSGQSIRSYPPDCPPLNVQWFHAVDVPKRKPKILVNQITKKPSTPPPQPKKYSAFTTSDSKSIESAYQKLMEAAEASGGINAHKQDDKRSSTRPRATRSNTTLSESEAGTRIPVNEDFLFDVDIEKRELAPVYWLGPIYDVRRGTWFYQEGTNLRPCEENLAAQLEEVRLSRDIWKAF
jgi:hypothetical protein